MKGEASEGREAGLPGGESEGAGWRDVTAAGALAPGSVRPARVGGVRLAVGRTREGFFVVDGLCPHAGAVLGEGLVEGRQLICPQHAYAFDVATGHCDDDPTCSVRSYPVRVADGRLQVQLPGAGGAGGGKDARSGKDARTGGG